MKTIVGQTIPGCHNMPNEILDIYTDSFTVTVTPFGTNISFGKREPHPHQNQIPKTDELVIVRTSIEHLKLFVMMARTQVKDFEERAHIKYDVPKEVLNSLRIPQEDWDAFWK